VAAAAVPRVVRATRPRPREREPPAREVVVVVVVAPSRARVAAAFMLGVAHCGTRLVDAREKPLRIMATLVARARAVVVSARADASHATFATGYRRATTPELDALCVKAIDVDGANAPASPTIKRLALGDRDASGLLSALRARDWALLEHTSARTSFASAPSAFVRKQTGPPGGALIARIGSTTTLIGSSCVYVFEPRSSVARHIANALHAWRREGGRAGEDGVRDFPVAALESALDESSRYYEEKFFRLRRLARHCVEEISNDLRGVSEGSIMTSGNLNYSSTQFQKFPPVRRAVTELESDSKEALDALNAAMETHLKTSDLLPPPLGAETLDDDTLKAREEAVTDMLASHARRVAAIGGLVRELTADLDSARELWELQLDGDRNRTVQMNFRASIVAMSAAIAAVPASLGGMNVPHGLEEAPIELFWSLAGGIICGSTAIWYAYMRRFQRAGEITNRRASELASMQYILSHMDSLDNAFDGVSASVDSDGTDVTREALRDAMRANASEAEPNGPTEDEVYDMLFSIYDTDRSQGIDVKEWRRK
tara:strand:+ start:16817 stop:18451 length:1635 start_codon:yes stop_codon:yes gene_type:complete